MATEPKRKRPRVVFRVNVDVAAIISVSFAIWLTLINLGYLPH